MGMRRGSAHGLGAHTGRLLIAASTVALVVTLGAATTTAASPTACRVQNAETGKAYKALQAAVDAARKGDRLTVRGTCVGKTVIDVRLVIVGIRTTTSGKPTLSGAGKVRVVEIETLVGVTLRDLVVTRGMARRGAGILNRGDLTLRDVQVRRNNDDFHVFSGEGPGVCNEGRLRLNGATRIAGNGLAAGAGGEVFNGDRLAMNGSSSIGYVANARDAALTMNGASSVLRILNNSGRVTMNDASWVRPAYDSEGSESGTGVVNSGTFTMNDASSIRGGRRQSAGVCSSQDGGAPFAAHATFTMNDASSISGNPSGGLLNWQDGVVTMNDASSIHDNTRHCDGGGVQMRGGRLRMTGSSSITANTALGYPSTDGFRGCDGVGGGIWHLRGALVGVMCGPGGNVVGNAPDDCYFYESP